ncbi:MAG: type II secretion system minor pseudopilin GspK [Desulfohalobiaceae bacterium]|nr:type II secretion system minor pseudopilin GspK [Desulfohalobiaceae bacterium]
MRKKKNRKKEKDQPEQQGSILVLVLLIISVLVVMVLESMHQMQVEATSSKIYAASVQGRALARSGLEFTKYLLTRDQEMDQEEENSKSDHYGEFWAGFLDQEEVEPPLFTTGELNATLVDEQGKFPINALVDENGNYRIEYREVLARLLHNEVFSLEPERIEEILYSLKDWLDADDEPESEELGAEKDYYIFQEKDYECKNAELSTLGELTLIRGIDQELYHGQDEKPGLKDLLTVHSDGKININTAPVEILAALVKPDFSDDMAMEFAQDIVKYRQDPNNFDSLTEGWWQPVKDELGVGLSNVSITKTSDYFSALITARVGSIPVKAYAVLKRGGTAEDEIEVVHYEVQ